MGRNHQGVALKRPRPQSLAGDLFGFPVNALLVATMLLAPADFFWGYHGIPLHYFPEVLFLFAFGRNFVKVGGLKQLLAALAVSVSFFLFGWCAPVLVWAGVGVCAGLVSLLPVVLFFAAVFMAGYVCGRLRVPLVGTRAA